MAFSCVGLADCLSIGTGPWQQHPSLHGSNVCGFFSLPITPPFQVHRVHSSGIGRGETGCPMNWILLLVV